MKFWIQAPPKTFIYFKDIALNFETINKFTDPSTNCTKLPKKFTPKFEIDRTIQHAGINKKSYPLHTDWLTLILEKLRFSKLFVGNFFIYRYQRLPCAIEKHRIIRYYLFAWYRKVSLKSNSLHSITYYTNKNFILKQI